MFPTRKKILYFVYLITVLNGTKGVPVMDLELLCYELAAQYNCVSQFEKATPNEWAKCTIFITHDTKPGIHWDEISHGLPTLSLKIDVKDEGSNQTTNEVEVRNEMHRSPQGSGEDEVMAESETATKIYPKNPLEVIPLQFQKQKTINPKLLELQRKLKELKELQQAKASRLAALTTKASTKAEAKTEIHEDNTEVPIVLQEKKWLVNDKRFPPNDQISKGTPEEKKVWLQDRPLSNKGPLSTTEATHEVINGKLDLQELSRNDTNGTVDPSSHEQYVLSSKSEGGVPVVVGNMKGYERVVPHPLLISAKGDPALEKQKGTVGVSLKLPLPPQKGAPLELQGGSPVENEKKGQGVPKPSEAAPIGEGKGQNGTNLPNGEDPTEGTNITKGGVKPSEAAPKTSEGAPKPSEAVSNTSGAVSKLSALVPKTSEAALVKNGSNRGNEDAPKPSEVAPVENGTKLQNGSVAPMDEDTDVTQGRLPTENGTNLRNGSNGEVTPMDDDTDVPQGRTPNGTSSPKGGAPIENGTNSPKEGAPEEKATNLTNGEAPVENGTNLTKGVASKTTPEVAPDTTSASETLGNAPSTSETAPVENLSKLVAPKPSEVAPVENGTNGPSKPSGKAPMDNGKKSSGDSPKPSETASVENATNGSAPSEKAPMERGQNFLDQVAFSKLHSEGGKIRPSGVAQVLSKRPSTTSTTTEDPRVVEKKLLIQEVLRGGLTESTTTAEPTSTTEDQKAMEKRIMLEEALGNQIMKSKEEELPSSLDAPPKEEQQNGGAAKEEKVDEKSAFIKSALELFRGEKKILPLPKLFDLKKIAFPTWVPLLPTTPPPKHTPLRKIDSEAPIPPKRPNVGNLYLFPFKNEVVLPDVNQNVRAKNVDRYVHVDTIEDHTNESVGASTNKEQSLDYVHIMDKDVHSLEIDDRKLQGPVKKKINVYDLFPYYSHHKAEINDLDGLKYLFGDYAVWNKGNL